MSKSDEGRLSLTLNSIFMKQLKYSIGIDMAKTQFKACFSVIDEQQKVTIKSQGTFANNLTGFEELYAWTQKHTREKLPLHFLVEATGIYHENLAWFLYTKDCSISVILPNKAKKYIQGLGLKSKNDKSEPKNYSHSPKSIDVKKARVLARAF
jgi:transposase